MTNTNIFFIIKKKKNERREAEIRMGKIKIIQTSVALSLVLNNVADVAVLAHVANETLESETDTPSHPIYTKNNIKILTNLHYFFAFRDKYEYFFYN